jgi:hypothetical protein
MSKLEYVDFEPIARSSTASRHRTEIHSYFALRAVAGKRIAPVVMDKRAIATPPLRKTAGPSRGREVPAPVTSVGMPSWLQGEHMDFAR